MRTAPMNLISAAATIAMFACSGTEGITPLPSGGGESSVGGQVGASGASPAGSNSTTVGGTKAAGGASSSVGGITASGGSSTSGGSQPTGGSEAAGGAQPTGGSKAMGGTPATGGSSTSGGSQPAGGSKAAGGATTAGGSKADGGTTATGGSAAQGGSNTGGSTKATGGSSGGTAGSSSGGTAGSSSGGTAGSSSGGTSGSTGGKTGATGGVQGTGGAATAVNGEKYPFPQNVKYPYGLQTTKVSNDYVKKWYDAWSKKYLQSCNGNVRPGVDPLSKSLVEAQGFAMVAAAYMGDKPVFDQLYNYYKAKCTSSGCGMMGWKNSCDGFEDQGSATDGDVDVASGLVVADWQWPGSGYDTKAQAVITNLKKMILTCSGKSTLYPGCSGGSPWGGCNETDISYYSPAFFRYFAKVSGDSGWTKLADDTHLIRDAAANSSTGLVPDWQSVSGTAGAGSRKGYYSFDAMRAPYKQALDYLWNGNDKALAWCKKITTWANGVGVQNIKDGYQLNGTVQGSNHNLAVVGSLAVASMANTQDILDAFAAESVKLSDDYWYSGYLGTLYLLALSGNMWNPDIVGN